MNIWLACTRGILVGRWQVVLPPSSSGRTTVFGTVNVGSNPAGAAKVGSEVMSIISAVVRLNNFEGFMIEVC